LLVRVRLIGFNFSTNSRGPVQDPIQLSPVLFPFRVHDFVTRSGCCFFDSHEVLSFPSLLPISLTRTTIRYISLLSHLCYLNYCVVRFVLLFSWCERCTRTLFSLARKICSRYHAQWTCSHTVYRPSCPSSVCDTSYLCALITLCAIDRRCLKSYTATYGVGGKLWVYKRNNPRLELNDSRRTHETHRRCLTRKNKGSVNGTFHRKPTRCRSRQIQTRWTRWLESRK
jgi:hypothetical protein